MKVLFDDDGVHFYSSNDIEVTLSDNEARELLDALAVYYLGTSKYPKIISFSVLEIESIVSTKKPSELSILLVSQEQPGEFSSVIELMNSINDNGNLRIVL